MKQHTIADIISENARRFPEYRHSPDEVTALIRDNEQLAELNAQLRERVEDLEKVIRRLWQRGRAAAPSPRELRAMAADAHAQANRDRGEAEQARVMARQSLQWAMQARSDAFVTQTHLHEVNDSLEGEKSAAREWAATDAAELSRKMSSLTAELQQEQQRSAMLQADLERSEASRAADVGRLLAEVQALRAAGNEVHLPLRACRPGPSILTARQWRALRAATPPISQSKSPNLMHFSQLFSALPLL